MTVNRRQFAKVAGTATLAIAWQQACTEVERTGEVTAETVRTLLDAQGPRGIYEDAGELEHLRAAVRNLIGVQAKLRDFPLDPDEQPLVVFWRG